MVTTINLTLAMNFTQVLLNLLSGLGITIIIFVATLVLALPLGLLIAFCSMSKNAVFKWIAKIYIWIMRGTPLMLQIIVISFLPSMLGTSSKEIVAFFGIKTYTLNIILVIIAFVLNYAAYFSEIFRSGIESIPKGQYEAGMMLGLSKREIFFKVIFMQVVRRITPPMSNEIITLVKDTALAQVLGVAELFTSAQRAVNSIVFLYPLLCAGIFYLLFNGLLTILLSKFEKRLSYYTV